MKKLDVLLIDDDEYILDLFKENIVNRFPDIKIECLHDTLEALYNYESSKVNVVICDYNFKTIRGDVFIKLFRAGKSHHDVIISGSDVALGQNDSHIMVFSKPFNFDLLFCFLESILSS